MFRKTLLTFLSRVGYTTDSLVNDQAVGLGRSELTPLERKTAARNIRASPLDERGSLSRRDRRRPLSSTGYTIYGACCTRFHCGSGLESKRAIGDDENDTRD